MNWTRMILVFAAAAAPLGFLPAASAKVLEVGRTNRSNSPVKRSLRRRTAMMCGSREDSISIAPSSNRTI
jgi:hypothetical protein